MVTTADIRERAGETPITMLTAYDAPTARIIDEAGVDMILVGDSMGNAMLGYDTTLPVTLEEMHSHTAAVARASENALVVADMPFLSFGVDEADSIENAGRLLKESDADAVKLECGRHTIELTERLTQLGIPVMAHLGLTPQHVNQIGGYSRQGTDYDAARDLIELAISHQQAGAFSLVLEHVPANVAKSVTEELSIPTIGIGAGGACDGQVLVITDVLGLEPDSPSFSKQYGDVRAEMKQAVDAFTNEVESGDFPADEHVHFEEGLDELD